MSVESEYLLSGCRSKYTVMDCEEAGKSAYIVHSFVAFATGLRFSGVKSSRFICVYFAPVYKLERICCTCRV